MKCDILHDDKRIMKTEKSSNEQNSSRQRFFTNSIQDTLNVYVCVNPKYTILSTSTINYGWVTYVKGYITYGLRKV